MIKLNLGCGGHRKEGFINVDKRATSQSDMVCDITALPFRENVIDEIEALHVLEHIDNKVLVHWYKILKPGGKIIIEVPDMDRIFKKYVRDNRKLKEIVAQVYGMQRFDGDAHVYGYDGETIKELFEKYKFKVLKVGPGECPYRDSTTSLRLEAIK